MNDPHRRLRQEALRVASLTGRTPSPCVSLCQMDERSGWCKGCLRSLDEIVRWSHITEAERQDIWQRLAQRHLPNPQVG